MTSRAIAPAAAAVLLGSAAAVAGSLAVRALAARALPVADFGMFALALAIVTAVGGAAGLGLNAASAQRLASLLSSSQPGHAGHAESDLGPRQAAQTAARRALMLAVASGALAAAVLAAAAAGVAAGLGQPGLAEPLAALAPVVLGLAVGNAVMGIGRAWGDVAGRALVRDGFGGLARLAGVVVALATGDGPSSAARLACGYAAGALLGESSAMLYGCWRGWFGRRLASESTVAGRSARSARTAVTRGLGPFAMLAALGQVAQWGDMLLVGALAPAAAVAAYGVARGVVRVLELVSEAAAHRFLPDAAASAAAGGLPAIAALYRTNRDFVLRLIWPAAAVGLVAPEPVVGLVFGPVYAASAAGPLRILIGGLLLSILCGYNQHALIALGGARRAGAALAFGAAAGLAVGVLAIPPLGALGGALSWTAMIVTQNLALSVALHRRGGRGLLAAGLGRLLLRVVLPTAAGAAVLARLPMPALAAALAVGAWAAICAVICAAGRPPAARDATIAT